MAYTGTKRQFEEMADDEIRTKNKARQIGWYRIYWLNEFTTHPIIDYGIDQLRLRGIIDYLETYTNIHQLLDDIKRFENTNEQIIILLTISSTLDSFYQLEHCSQIHSIYIHALSSESNTIIDKINTHAKVTLLL